MSRRLTLIFWPWGFIGLVFAVVVVALALKPVYHAAKRWRAGTFLKRADSALKAGYWKRADEQASLALQMDPNSLEAVRVLARSARQQGSSSCVALWSEVAQWPEATESDRVELAAAALQFGFQDVAEKQVEVLLAQPRPSAAVYRLAGILAHHEQQPGIAREWFERALQLDPKDAGARVNIAELDLLAPANAGSEQRALNSLRELARRRDEWGLESLRILVSWARRKPAAMPFDPGLAAALRSHPLAGMRESCLAADWEMQSHPEHADELLRDMVARASSLPPPDQRELAQWLNRHKFFEQTIRAFPPDAKLSPQTLVCTLDAMAALGKWSELNRFLEQDLFTEQPALVWLFRARAARELRNAQVFEVDWRQAVRSAGNDPAMLRYLGYYAEMLGETAAAVAAYEALRASPPDELEALLRLIRPYEALGRTTDLQKVFERLAVLRPNDAVVRNDYAYLTLLLNPANLDARQKAEQNYRANPRLPAFAATYALSELRQGRPSTAVTAMRAVPADEITAPGWQAVFAASLKGNGDKAEAAKWAHLIDTSHLKPEERALVADMVGGSR
ncbi:MAG: hypothetical protein JO317_03910 [Verrucomicrobiae bacterium]|nr:hypothetical protein [Verrucomicrobiae bacterium]